jgi:hypothetical protein
VVFAIDAALGIFGGADGSVVSLANLHVSWVQTSYVQRAWSLVAWVDFEQALSDLTEALSHIPPRHFAREHPSDERIASIAESDRGGMKTQLTRIFRGHRTSPAMPILDPAPIGKIDLASGISMTELPCSLDRLNSQTAPMTMACA